MTVYSCSNASENRKQLELAGNATVWQMVKKYNVSLINNHQQIAVVQVE